MSRHAYSEAGVDVEAGDRAIDLIRRRLAEDAGLPVAGGRWPEILSGIGGFAAAVGVPGGFREPVLVSGTDGVGTKTAIAASLGRYETIGQDLVAMCADDVVCAGARPLFFLDYIALGRLVPEMVAELVGGIASGCRTAGCALVGGETAEHPGLLEPGEFDVAGFCVAIVERDQLLDGSAAQTGDALIGLASDGLHATGYSLIRSLVDRHQLDLEEPYLEVLGRILGAEELERVSAEEPDLALATLGHVLLIPTRIYAPDVLELRDSLAAAGTPLRGLAHVTGGGLPGNIPRALPEGVGARLDPSAWPVPAIFRLVAALGSLDEAEVRATLNAGLGMVAVVPPEAVGSTLGLLSDRGLAAWKVGDVVPVEELGGARYLEVSG